MSSEPKNTVAEGAVTHSDESAVFNDLLRSLKRRGFSACAERLVELWCADDIDEYNEPLALESVRGFVKLMDVFQDLGEPMLGRCLAGTLSVEWRIANDKHLLVEALNGDEASFMLIGSPGRPGEEFHANGSDTIAEVVHALRKHGIDEWCDA